MTDRLDERIEACQAELSPTLQLAIATYDFRIVLAVLVTRAAELAQSAISAKAFTTAQAFDYFFAAFRNALEPRKKPADVMYVDSDQPVGRKQ